MALAKLLLLICTLVVNVDSVFSQSEKVDSSLPYQTKSNRRLIHYNNRVYTDTSWTSSFKPDSIFVYYYNVRSKYPESSETIRSEADAYLQKTNQRFTGSGYITFRFFIDSAGQILKRVQVLQTDELYKEYYFSEDFVWVLFDFLMTMHKWKPAAAPRGYPPFYINILTFKIHEGTIVNIIP